MAIQILSDRVAFLPGGANIGILRGEGGRCVLIDTGLNETSAKKALKAVREELGGEVAAVLTTHGHADHFGGNATVVKRTGAKVHAPAIDEAFLRYPLLQPICLFAGASPPASMRGGFMLADASPVDVVVDGRSVVIEGIEIGIVRLAGHSPNQLGYLIDDVFFCADLVLPEPVLEKYKIPYLHSVSDHIAALTGCTDVAHRFAVPGHGPMAGRIDALRDLNLALVLDVADRVREFCAGGSTGEEVLRRLLGHYGADVRDAPSYYLLHPTAFSFLAHLEGAGVVRHSIENGRSLWTAA
ncbi:MAG: MBL fold metallo-hydrolase [Thermomicrobiales bacterium]